MPRRIQLLGWRQMALCAMLFAAACSSTPTVAPTNTPDAAATSAAGTAEAVQIAQREEAAVATGVAATLTAAPTNTPTDTEEPTATPTATKKPTNTPTSTPEDTDTPEVTATFTRTPGPTLPPVTNTPTPKPTSASVYGFTGGVDGYITDIDCTFSGGACVPTMPQGDVSFDFVLVSGPETPLTLFEKYGLSVERDGVNVAEMFMFVDAGLLPPDTGVRFGASRNFNIPGRYVVRSSGCLTTVPAPCGWQTMIGTTVTFTIK